MLISLLSLLLLAAQAQGAREPLAVLVVGVDNWMFGDVLAHIVGEELKRGNPNLVPVTREKFVQNKLKALRRTSGEINLCELREWANNQQLAQVCFVEAKAGNGYPIFSFKHDKQAYSAQVINVADSSCSCVADFDFSRDGAGKMAMAELTKVAWEVVGRLQSSNCKTSNYIKCYSYEPEMVFVKGGEYMMGGSSRVILSDFWIGKYEVTQAEWAKVMRSYPATPPNGTTPGSRPSGHASCETCPVEKVNWGDVKIFLDTLNRRTGKNYRLPTEAQWEYAARGGNAAPSCNGGCKYSGSDTVWHVAWYSENSGKTTHKVGTRKTAPSAVALSPVVNGNELGIHDMSGNVFEWCRDYYSTSLPSGKDPECTSGSYSDSYRIARGGSWLHTTTSCRVADRTFISINLRQPSVGFRVVLP
ncbi:MAG: formylglycine-generating enzyme family protein [Prevotellaceae bacterium]|nr:formylglycine-generating enzyme family protein [Prevotellaceae bacterium]